MYKLKTTAKTLEELRNAIKTKIDIDKGAKIGLEFKENGKLYVLDNMEDLEEGMTIKVSNQLQQNDGNFSLSSFLFFFFFFFCFLLF